MLAGLLLLSLLVTARSPFQQDPAGAPSVALVGGEKITCDDASFDQHSGRPANKMGLSGVPSEFGPVPALQATDPATGDFVITPVDGRAGRAGVVLLCRCILTTRRQAARHFDLAGRRWPSLRPQRRFEPGRRHFKHGL